MKHVIMLLVAVFLFTGCQNNKPSKNVISEVEKNKEIEQKAREEAKLAFTNEDCDFFKKEGDKALFLAKEVTLDIENPNTLVAGSYLLEYSNYALANYKKYEICKAQKTTSKREVIQ